MTHKLLPFLLLIPSGFAFAQDAASTPAPPSPSAEPAAVAPAPPAEQARVTVAPYVWMTSLSGDLGVRGVEFDATQSFIDILDNSDFVFGLMGAVDVEYNRFVFEFSGAWTTAQVSKTQGVFRNATVAADVDVDSAWFELFGGYRVLDEAFTLDTADDSRFAFDLFGGGRVTVANLNSTLRASTALTLPDGRPIAPGLDRELDRTAEWFEPFVGARMVFDLTEHWTLTLRGDVGGFDVDDSQFAWQAQAIVGYHWRLESGADMGIFGGYRAIGQDYESDNFKWDLITHGPVLGAALTIPF